MKTLICAVILVLAVGLAQSFIIPTPLFLLTSDISFINSPRTKFTVSRAGVPQNSTSEGLIYYLAANATSGQPARWAHAYTIGFSVNQAWSQVFKEKKGAGSITAVTEKHPALSGCYAEANISSVCTVWVVRGGRVKTAFQNCFFKDADGTEITYTMTMTTDDGRPTILDIQLKKSDQVLVHALATLDLSQNTAPQDAWLLPCKLKL